jgi:hypothetical protein
MSNPKNPEEDDLEPQSKEAPKPDEHDLEPETRSNGLERRLAELAEKYMTRRKNTAAEYIARCEVIVQAEDEIGKKHLVEFYARIGEDPAGSTIRKMRKIGQNAARFKPVMDRVSNDWTTMYCLAVLPPEKFSRLVEDGVLNPSATWKELSAHVSEAKPKKPKKVRPRITLELDDVPLGKRSRFVRQMTDICKEFSVPLAEAQRATLDGFVPASDAE